MKAMILAILISVSAASAQAAYHAPAYDYYQNNWWPTNDRSSEQCTVCATTA